MTSGQASSFISAMEDAGIDNYYFVTDTPTNFHHNADSIVKQNGDLLVNIRKPQYSHYRMMNGVEIVAADLADVHEARAVGTAEQLRQVAESLGVSLTDDEYKIIINQDKKNYELKPITGDYRQFVFLTTEQYEALDDDEKAKYDEACKFEGELVGFKKLGKQEYEWLTPEDKAKYDELLAKYELAKSKELPVNQAAQISFK